jgi:hypothetical protein
VPDSDLRGLFLEIGILRPTEGALELSVIDAQRATRGPPMAAFLAPHVLHGPQVAVLGETISDAVERCVHVAPQMKRPAGAGHQVAVAIRNAGACDPHLSSPDGGLVEFEGDSTPPKWRVKRLITIALQ